MANTGRAEPSDRWFVQIKDKIHGPLGGEKVLGFLLADQISVMTRVSMDRRNWNAICNTPFFEELVLDRIRAYSGASESVGRSMGGTHTGPNSDFESSQVNIDLNAIKGIDEQLDHARQLEELTANIQKLNALRKEIQLKRKTVVVEKSSDEEEIHPDDQNVFIPAASKKATWKEMFSGQVKYRKQAIVGGALVLVGMICTIGYRYYTQAQELAAEKAKIQEALAQQSKGNYEQAVKSLAGVQNLRNTKPEQIIALAEAHIRSKNPRAGRELLQQAIATGLPNELRAQAYAMSARASEALGDTASATIEYEQSLKAGEIFQSLFAFGILRLKSGALPEAETLMLKAIQVAGEGKFDTAPAIGALFEISFKLDSKDRALARQKDPNSPLQPMSRTIKVGAIIDNALKDRAREAGQTKPTHLENLHYLRAFVDFYTAPFETFQLTALPVMQSTPGKEDVAVEKDVSYDFIKWSKLYSYCTDIYRQPGTGDFVSAFFASCVLRSHDAQKALPYAKYSHTAKPLDPVYRDLYAWTLISLKQHQEARQVIAGSESAVPSSSLEKAIAAELRPEEPPRDPAAAASPAP